MQQTNITKLSDYTSDSTNVNKGSEYGDALLEKSIIEGGLGRSIEVDKNGVIIAGNKTHAKASQLGFENAIEIEVDGKTLVVVKRKDLDINSPEGIRHKILDNTVSKHNYVEDAEVMEVLAEAADIEELGLTADAQEQKDYSGSNKEVDIDAMEDEMILKLKFTESQYAIIKGQLAKLTETPEQAFWRLLGNE